MNTMQAVCLDKSSSADLVLHQVVADFGGRPFVVQLQASDPQHAIQRAQSMPQNLWKEVNNFQPQGVTL